jgi:uncharacterized membrane protein YhaH (DUF805 family)
MDHMASHNPYQAPSHRSAPPGLASPGIKAMLFSTRGRISRSAFWTWTLVLMAALAVLIAAIMVPLLMFESSAEAKGDKESIRSAQMIAMAVFGIGYIPLFWANAVVQVKRWHDRGKPGAWFFISFIPYLGGLWVLIECGCLRGNPHGNEYGPDPLA